MGEALRHIKGGVIGCFTPVEATLNFTETPELGEVGEVKLGIKVPAGKFVYGVFARNANNDLEADGEATITVKVGETTELNALALAAVKGTGKAKIVGEPLYVNKDTELLLDISVANLTKGKLSIGVLYG